MKSAGRRGGPPRDQEVSILDKQNPLYKQKGAICFLKNRHLLLTCAECNGKEEGDFKKLMVVAQGFYRQYIGSLVKYCLCLDTFLHAYLTSVLLLGVYLPVFLYVYSSRGIVGLHVQLVHIYLYVFLYGRSWWK